MFMWKTVACLSKASYFKVFGCVLQYNGWVEKVVQIAYGGIWLWSTGFKSVNNIGAIVVEFSGDNIFDHFDKVYLRIVKCFLCYSQTDILE
jgi:hypothetical protein